MPGFAFLHDFALTPQLRHLFPKSGEFWPPLPFLLGFKGAAECISFDSKQPTRILLIPRNGQDPMQVIETDPCFVFHHANAFEQDGQIVVDSICYDRFPTLEGASDYKTGRFRYRASGENCGALRLI